MDRIDVVREEIAQDVASIEELEALLCDPDYAGYATLLRDEIAEARSRLQEVKAPVAEKSGAVKVEKQPVKRIGRKYRLLNTDVRWSSTPQVHAVMAILAAHVEVGEAVDEEYIVRAMVANEDALGTRQGGKRIWDYYKGNNDKGLAAHGNIERI